MRGGARTAAAFEGSLQRLRPCVCEASRTKAPMPHFGSPFLRPALGRPDSGFSGCLCPGRGTRRRGRARRSTILSDRPGRDRLVRRHEAVPLPCTRRLRDGLRRTEQLLQGRPRGVRRPLDSTGHHRRSGQLHRVPDLDRGDVRPRVHAVTGGPSAAKRKARGVRPHQHLPIRRPGSNGRGVGADR